MSKRILIIAGGTGGHIFPALAVAKTLAKNGANIHWLGSNRGMENTLVPQHGFDLSSISAVGLRGKSLINLIKAPFLLSWAFLQSLLIFLKIKPAVVLGMGGFTAGIGGVAAWLLRIPLIIHEQNAVAGSTNRLLSKIANKTFTAFDNSFAQNIKTTTCGNPILFNAKTKINNKTGRLNLLIIGGSLGAKAINEVIVGLNLNINIWHQTGKLHYKTIKSRYQPQQSNIKIEAFIEDMASAYAWADVVICRAGAMTVSELMLSATASILIPLPTAIDNHQFYNAKILSDNGAGILIQQQDLSAKLLTKTLLNLNDKTIKTLSNNALKLAKPFAAKEIADYISGIT